MAGKIPDETLQAIRERVSIVEVVSGYVSLKKAGRNYVGLCPFHSEKTPSFTVNDERGLFHCFGCGAGGTVFTFVMRADRLEFLEVVEMLARRAGVTLPQRSERGPGGGPRDELIELNDTAQRCFRAALQSARGAAARHYLEQRGVGAATVECYGLGFCPPNGSGLARALMGRPSAIHKAVELGLLGRRADGSLYDRLWGRVTFPIRHGRGYILGFGGRTLGAEHPKYLNSPESPLFHKGEVLYGLFEARAAIREAERIVIVEGYLDALALVEAGIGCAVASLGTALSAAQLRLARRFAPEVVVFFDGDRAGQDAAVRSFSVCAEAGVWGLGAFLPEGFDPDTYVRTKGPAAVRTLLEQAIPLADFFIARLDPGPQASVPQRARAVEQVGRVIRQFQDPVFSLLARQAAQQLRVDEAVFREMRTAAPHRPSQPQPVARPAVQLPPEESKLLEAMALDQEVARLVSHRCTLDAFRSAALAEAGRAVIAAWERERSSVAALEQLPAGMAGRVTAGLLGEGAMAGADPMQVARDCIERIERLSRQSRARRSLAELREAERRGDEAAYREQLKRHNELLRGEEVERG
ncbi:MAG TPA: DNA primase [Candidatus Margulisiibacteriota bacterium]|nr:DNA primase [Candidatus Margulisiibacteriota bacterium]